MNPVVTGSNASFGSGMFRQDEDPLTKHRRPGLDTYFLHHEQEQQQADAACRNDPCNASLPSGCTTITSVSNWPTNSHAQVNIAHSVVEGVSCTLSIDESQEDCLSYPSSVNDSTYRSLSGHCAAGTAVPSGAVDARAALAKEQSVSSGLLDMQSTTSKPRSRSRTRRRASMDTATSSGTSETGAVGYLRRHSRSHSSTRKHSKSSVDVALNPVPQSAPPSSSSSSSSSARSKSRTTKSKRRSSVTHVNVNVNSHARPPKTPSNSQHRSAPKNNTTASTAPTSSTATADDIASISAPATPTSVGKSEKISLQRFLETNKLADQFLQDLNLDGTDNKNRKQQHNNIPHKNSGQRQKRRSKSRSRKRRVNSSMSSLGSSRRSLASTDNSYAEGFVSNEDFHYHEDYHPPPSVTSQNRAALVASAMAGLDDPSIASYPDELDSLPSIGGTTINTRGTDTGAKSVLSQESFSSRRLHRTRIGGPSVSPADSGNANRTRSYSDQQKSITAGLLDDKSVSSRQHHHNRRRQRQSLNDVDVSVAASVPRSKNHRKSTGSTGSRKDHSPPQPKSSRCKKPSSSSLASLAMSASSISPRPGRRAMFSRSQSEHVVTALLSNSLKEQSDSKQSSRRQGHQLPVSPTPSAIQDQRRSDLSPARSTASKSLAFLDENNHSCPVFDHDATSLISSTADVADAPTIDAQGNPGTYTGTIHTTDQVPHGYGRMQYNSEGSYYQGQWVKGIRSGHGKSCNSIGDLYIGTFWDDKEHGNGTIRFSDGRIVQGLFEAGQLQSGIMNYQDGSKYKGSFSNGKRNGGKYYFVDGSVYEGEFCNDMMEGQGTLFWSNGSKYVGQWKGGVRHGEGIEYRPDGSVRHSGVWANGKIAKGQH